MGLVRCVGMARVRMLTAQLVLHARRASLGREAAALRVPQALSQRWTAQAARHARQDMPAPMVHVTCVLQGRCRTGLRQPVPTAKLGLLGLVVSARCVQTVRSQMHSALHARSVLRARQERLGRAACARLGESRRLRETLASLAEWGRQEHWARAVFAHLAELQQQIILHV